MIAKKIYEFLNFERKSEPFKKIGIGKFRESKLKNALLQSIPTEETDEWLANEPEIRKLLKYELGDWKDILGVDTETYCEENNIDPEELSNDFICKETKLFKQPPSLNLKIGNLLDGTKVIFYFNSLCDGYLTRKEWIKNNETNWD